MASNIGTNGTFTTSNMKPASGEVIDALWGQNLGDNLGYLFHKEEQLPGVELTSGGNKLYLYTFKKSAAHNAIRFKSRGKSGTQGTITESYELANTEGGATILSGTWTHGRGTGIVFMQDFNISSLGDGTNYFFFHDSQHLTLPTEGAWASLIHGTGATY